MDTTPPMQKRGDAYADHPTLRDTEEAFRQLFTRDEGAHCVARSVVVTKTLPMVPSLLGTGVALVMPYSMHEPEEPVIALGDLLQKMKPETVILSGGNTSPHHDISEAEILYDKIRRRGITIPGDVVLEKRSTNTAENFGNVAGRYGDIIARAPYTIILAHALHSTRCRAAFRKAVMEQELMSEEAFNHRVLVSTYRLWGGNHRLEMPENVAAALARLRVYDQAGEITLMPEERDAIEKLYLRAVTPGVSRTNDRRDRCTAA